MDIFNWFTPNISLQDAVRSGKLRAVKKILQRGVEQNELNNCLGYAQHEGLGMVKLLVEHGADVNYQPSDVRKRPLHLAATSGYPEIVAYLIDQGATVNAVDKDGDTALDCAYELPLDEEILALRGASTAPFNDASKKRRQLVAEVLTRNGGKGGHSMPPQVWGPVKSRVVPLVLYARMNFPTASAEELSKKVLEKLDLKFESGMTPDHVSRMKNEVLSVILKECIK